MKKINELTEDQAKEIIEFVYPDKGYFLQGLSFEPEFNKEGHEHVTFGMRSQIGILYHSDQDKCILHFDDTKVVLWLYNNGFDIKEILEMNDYMSEMENDFDNAMFEVHFTLEHWGKYNMKKLEKKFKKIVEEYYSKDY